MTKARSAASVPSTVDMKFSALTSTVALPLFQVNGGISASEALQSASLYLAAAQDLSASSVDENDGDGSYAVSYLLELAKALVDSVQAGLPR